VALCKHVGHSLSLDACLLMSDDSLTHSLTNNCLHCGPMTGHWHSYDLYGHWRHEGLRGRGYFYGWIDCPSSCFVGLFRVWNVYKRYFCKSKQRTQRNIAWIQIFFEIIDKGCKMNCCANGKMQTCGCWNG